MGLEFAISVVALGIAVITATICVIAIVLARREPPDVAEVKSRLLALDQEVTDVNDRVGQWMRRESVRKMRDGKEFAKAAEEAIVPADKKSDLRRRAMLLRNTTS